MEPEVLTASSDKLETTGSGSCTIRVEDSKVHLYLRRVLHVPDLSNNILSVPALCQDGITVTFKKDEYYIKNGSFLMGKGKKQDGVYMIYFKKSTERAPRAFRVKCVDDVDKCHERLVHANKAVIREMIVGDAVSRMRNSENEVDEKFRPCMVGKMANGTMISRRNLDKRPGAVVYSDVGQLNVPYCGGNKYYVTFIDESTSHIRVKVVREKGEASVELEKHVAGMERQTGRRFVRIIIDEGL